MADFLDILLSRYTFLSTKEKLLLRDVCGNEDDLKRLDTADIERIIGRRLRKTRWSVKKALSEAENTAHRLAADGIKCLFFQESGYPPQLAEIWDPPYLLYLRGRLPDWNKPAAAVVGTRLATGRGTDAAFGLGLGFGERGLPIVSGLALGIDSAAHMGNMAASAGTVAVLGSGVDRIYPASNRKLALRILENGGALMSEYPPSSEVRKFNFPQRNRIISGLSRAVIVVEAPGKSGALITADFALGQGRDLYFHSAATSSPGNTERVEKLLFSGAPLIDEAEEVLRDWGWAGCRDIDVLPGSCPEQLQEAGEMLADEMRNELSGYRIKFNGNYFRRTYNESSYSVDS